MATADPSPEEYDKECTVCQDLFTEPKILPCAHTLCRHCLLTWLSSSKEGNCPSCKSVILTANQKDEGLEKAVARLPDDSSMAALVRCKRLLSKDQLCGGCGQAAVSICLHCSDLLCTTCTTAHHNLKATRHHKVQDLSNTTAEQLSISQPVTCCVHSDTPAELYCPTHDAAICQICASTEHRACSEPTLFEDHAKALREELSSISQLLKSVGEKQALALKDLDQQLQGAEEKAEQNIADINKAFDNLEMSLKEHRRHLQQRVLKSKEEFQQSVKKSQTVLLSGQGQVTSHQHIVDRVKYSSPAGELDGATMTIKTHLKELCLYPKQICKIKPMSMVTVNSTNIMQIKNLLSHLGDEKFPLTHLPEEDRVWAFHPSPSITLSCGDRTAEIVSSSSVVIMSASSMKKDKLYEVQLDEVKGSSPGHFSCGIVKCSPSSVDDFQKMVVEDWPESITFGFSVWRYGKQRGTNIGNKLKNLKEGTRIGFLLEAGRYLHLYIDGEKQWVHVNSAPDTCHVFFKLTQFYHKVTTLPLTHILAVR